MTRCHWLRTPLLLLILGCERESYTAPDWDRQPIRESIVIANESRSTFDPHDLVMDAIQGNPVILTPNQDEAFIVHLHPAAVAARGDIERKLHFSGHIIGRSNTAVRLSLVRGGLSGYIRDGDNWIFYEPLPTKDEQNAMGTPNAGSVTHRTFRGRDVVNPHALTCGADGLDQGPEQRPPDRPPPRRR